MSVTSEKRKKQEKEIYETDGSKKQPRHISSIMKLKVIK